jgi:hypothetical protein
MKTDFFTFYIPRFSCNLCNLRKSLDIDYLDIGSPFRGVKKVTQVTWIFWYILYPFSKMTIWQSLLAAWLAYTNLLIQGEVRM